jgi:N4-(beta-N-acetylglucosaminyl)-L-asparaginase
MDFSRRQFLGSTTAMSAATALGQEPIASSGKTVVITKYTGLQSIDGAYEMLRRGQDTLDAAIFVLKAQEDDPNDNTVGLGGLPNEDGEVELDAAVMHGPTRRAAAVGGVRRIRNVAALARIVMRHTGHALLVHEGAARVAKLFGFKEATVEGIDVGAGLVGAEHR